MAGIDHDTLLELIGEVQGASRLDEFREVLLHALKRAVPCDWISLSDIGRDPSDTVVLVEPEFPPEAHVLWARLAHENPLIARFGRTGDGRAYRFSDVATPDELHGTELYREFHGPLGLEHQIAFTLAHGPGRLLGLALSRRDRDFGDDDRALLDRARPFLIQAYRGAVESSELREELARRRSASDPLAPDNPLVRGLSERGLSRREADVMAGVALGRSNRSVADTLTVSERTVEKHLERGYRKLGVTTRSEASTLAWSLVEE